MSRMSEIQSHDYPSSPGFKEPTTSRAAASAVRPRVSGLHKEILAALGRLNATPDEVAVRLGETLLTIRPRFSELNRLGLIEKTGERRPNASGLKAAVWRPTR